MKNIVITPKDLKRELITWLFCLLIAFGMNIYAILFYETSWSELYSQAGYVVVVSIVLYLILWLFRGLFHLIRYLAGKNNSRPSEEL